MKTDSILVDKFTAICIAWSKEAYLVYWLDMLTLGMRELPTLHRALSTFFGPAICLKQYMDFLQLL